MSEQPGSLAAALIALQARLPHVTKDETAEVETKTGGYRYSYANLATITDAVLPRLAELGLYWTCAPTLTVDKFVLQYTLRHVSGEEITGEYPLPSGTPQTMGGAITYARRYALCAVTGIAPAEDDDDAADQARAQAERQQMRTRAVADEGVHSPPPHPRPADRTREPIPDDPWSGPDPDAPSTEAQHRRLGIQFGKIGITERDARLARAREILGLGELATSKALTFSQAEKLSRELEKRIKGARDGGV